MGGLGAAAYSPDLGLVPLGALPMARLPGSGGWSLRQNTADSATNLEISWEYEIAYDRHELEISPTNS